VRTFPLRSFQLPLFWAPFSAPQPREIVLEVDGELDFSVVPSLLAMARKPAASDLSWTFDLSKVSFIDAAVVGAFVAISNEMQARGRRLRLIRPSTQVVRPFTLVGLQGMLDVSYLAVALAGPRRATDPTARFRRELRHQMTKVQQ
jgi:anti-anti-sigma factor